MKTMTEQEFIKSYVNDTLEHLHVFEYEINEEITHKKIHQEIIGMNRLRRIQGLSKILWLSPDLVDSIVISLTQEIAFRKRSIIEGVM